MIFFLVFFWGCWEWVWSRRAWFSPSAGVELADLVLGLGSDPESGPGSGSGERKRAGAEGDELDFDRLFAFVRPKRGLVLACAQ
jgi:hypothetical protein